MLRTVSAALLASLALAGAASAATVSFTVATTTGAANPLAAATAGPAGVVLENTTGSITGAKRSPFEDGPADDDDFLYTAVSAGGSAFYDLGSLNNQVSFIWGSPDTYNLVTFYKDGVATGESFAYSNNGRNLADPFATIRTDHSFDAVEFSSSGIAFEFAELKVATVPLPAAGLLLLAALGAVGIGRRRA